MIWIQILVGARHFYVAQILQACSWGPSSLLFSGYQYSSLGVNLPGYEVDHSPPSYGEVEKRVELCFCSPFMHSWLGQGQRLQRWHKKEQRESDLLAMCHQHGPFRTNTMCTCLQFILQTTLNKLALNVPYTLKFLCLFKRFSMKRQYKIERGGKR